ncbi:MAG: hypothetical protein GY906_21520 [bacterium]|nr:hypothetical protein [bacterium]
MAQVKGTAFCSRIAYVERHHGGKALEQVFDQMKDQGCAASLKKRALPSGWYSFENYVDLLETIDRVCGKGDGSLFRGMASQVAQDDLSTIYRAFIRVASPAFVLKKASHIWRQYYDSGDLQVLKDQPGEVLLEVCDMPNPQTAHCESISGWVEQCVRMTGAANAKVSHDSCRVRGDDRCIFNVRWSS